MKQESRGTKLAKPKRYNCRNTALPPTEQSDSTQTLVRFYVYGLTAWRVQPQPETLTSQPPYPHRLHRTYSSPSIAIVPKAAAAAGGMPQLLMSKLPIVDDCMVVEEEARESYDESEKNRADVVKFCSAGSARNPMTA